MKTIQAKELETMAVRMLVKAGTPDDIATCVASSLVDSNLKGVDSHGITRISMYINQILENYIHPAARPEIVQETPTTAIVRGHFGFGIHALNFALDTAIEKAKADNLAAVGLFENTHTGRLGRYAELAAAQNIIASIGGGGGGRHARHCSVAPFGGAQRVMATNPLAIGIPGGKYGPIVIDMSTSNTAEGKLRLYRATGKPLPEGWIIDKDGKPSTDAEDFYAGGAILPAAAHKGYGLAIALELLGDALIGNPFELNWLVLALNIEAFRPIDEFSQDSEQVLDKVKSVHPAEGFSEVLLPGEPEQRCNQKRLQEGIPIPDEIWKQIEETAEKIGISDLF